ncbi:arginine--tRNA ligase [Panacibacter ginsenosidivorans]|uniref:Arginine--tRNA ligase n=1 Tax=Panacibacter ginsenosidivorans TaxID=1813871 RepID=A0A5B8V5X5_9BACT|nr:arginine--tRNA ligase [Panacibacter ginsenosidivorans]QEC66233.1 arginine--tRNA ligase [Panacibacter ginsenosidivorans]
MSVVNQIKESAATAIKALYDVEIKATDITVNATKPEFEGDYTIVLFSLVKQLRKAPDAAGNEMGSYLIEKHADLFSSFNVIKGFLNLVVADNYWLSFLAANYNNNSFGHKAKNGKKVMVEYSSPNTNKPLHLGHLRNNFLGWSTAEVLKADGYDIVKTCIVNDRGIHICKSMIAWEMFGNGATPESTNTKGDHFVGDYYVKFNDVYKKEIEELIATGVTKEVAEKEAPIMKAAQQMLVEWEAGKPDVIELWKRMNSWVYKGFDETYKRIGSNFDKVYYESETYLLGKDLVEDGLSKGVFKQKEDGSVWIDLTADGLDEKIVRRKDGTAVYITQDIGLVVNKYEEYKCDQSIYVVGDEQNYHFKVLKLIAQKLGLPSADGIYHLSYGMVELPTGKMKSREGTVVDADDLVDEMISISKQKTEELGKVKDFTADELKELYNTIGLGALKFFLLRVDPKKRMVFNPEESIDFHGFTGPFVQYTHARIKSILRKLADSGSDLSVVSNTLATLEKAVINQLEIFTAVIEEAATEHDPSKMAIYVFNLAKTFNSFYAEHSIANAENAEKKALRLQIAQLTAHTIKTAMQLLGINVPERM